MIWIRLILLDGRVGRRITETVIAKSLIPRDVYGHGIFCVLNLRTALRSPLLEEKERHGTGLFCMV